MKNLTLCALPFIFLVGCSQGQSLGKYSSVGGPCSTDSDCEVDALCARSTCFKRCDVNADCPEVTPYCIDIYCVDEPCGDGVVQVTEDCDDGVQNNGQYGQCNTQCSALTAFCGDGTVDTPHEVCDDGDDNGTPGACDANCQTEGATCGDGLVDTPTETCDDGVNNGSYGYCNTSCDGPASHCGDGTTDSGDGEACDDGLNNGSYAYCNASCSGLSSHCGDGSVDNGDGETCDDGANNGSYGYCNSTCDGPSGFCGDGAIDVPDEVCDDATNNGTPGSCASDCQGAFVGCGDGVVDPLTEVCDYGVAYTGDACDENCFNAEFEVNTFAASNQGAPQVHTARSGGIVVGFEANNHPEDSAVADRSYDIRFRRYDADGTPMTANDGRFNSTVSGAQLMPVFAGGPGGGFMGVWSNLSASPDTATIRAHDVFEFLNTDTKVDAGASTEQTALDITARGSYAVTWVESGSTIINGKHLIASGQVKNDTFRVNNTADTVTSPTVTQLDDSTNVYAWIRYRLDAAGGNTTVDLAIRMRRFDWDSSTSMDASDINVYSIPNSATPGNRATRTRLDCTDGSTGTNWCVIAWKDPHSEGLDALILYPDGTLITATPMRLDTGITDQNAVNLVRSGADEISVVWEKANEIYGQAITEAGTLVPATPVQLNIAADGAQSQPSIGSNDGNRFVCWTDKSTKATAIDPTSRVTCRMWPVGIAFE